MKQGTLDVDGTPVSTLLLRPRGALALFALAHGAGAGMRHPFMEAIAVALAARKIATLRFQFPYMEAGKKRPDPPARIARTIRVAIDAAARAKLPIFAGGKSMGGRIASACAARGELPEARGLIFLGFPLHAANTPSATRGAHLADVQVPMLFLQGTRDALADLKLLRPIVKKAKGTLHVIDDADHSFAVPKRAGRTSEEVIAELADAIAAFIHSVLE